MNKILMMTSLVLVALFSTGLLGAAFVMATNETNTPAAWFYGIAALCFATGTTLSLYVLARLDRDF